MIAAVPVVLLALGYLAALFGVAAWADRRAREGRSVVANPTVYALSLAVYCTAWTFYGSVGRAATAGAEFLTIYLGPTLALLLAPSLLRKVVRIGRDQRITSLADFLSARYGKSAAVGAVVTGIAVLGVVPYLSLQLKAVAASYAALTGHAEPGLLGDPGLWAAVGLAVFAALFGTRYLDVTERHEGLVAAVAAESLVKLVAFLAVGLFAVFGLYGGPAELLAQADAAGLLERPAARASGADWFALLGVSFFAVLLLPRQFQVAVVENTDSRHLLKAAWRFPLYLLAINLFVWPIALAGQLRLPPGADADQFVLTLPLAEGHPVLALLVFVGGLSAAASMAVVSAVALATMVSNHLVMPALLRWQRLQLAERANLAPLVLGVRRGAIALLLAAAYAYHAVVGGSYALVSIGLVSFAAVAQLAPAFLGALYWKTGNRSGALAGMTSGFLIWGYTLALPTLFQATGGATALLEAGPWGIGWLRPQALFGLEAFAPLTRGLFWSLGLNAALYLGVSAWTRAGAIERTQALAFVHANRFSRAEGAPAGRSVWRGQARVSDLRALLARYLGARRAADVLGRADGTADAALVHRAETALAGALGAASARVVVGAVVQEEPLDLPEVLGMLDEAQQTLAYSRALERKSAQLEEQRSLLAATTDELRAANERLLALDGLKDEFVGTVSHELRTPLTSIRAFAEILLGQPGLPPAQREEFLRVIVAEGERLSRLVDGVLRLQRADAEAHVRLDLREAVGAAVRAVGGADPGHIRVALPAGPLPVVGDPDAVVQVLVNLIGNAVKFAGQADVSAATDGARVVCHVSDDGPGIEPGDLARIFEPFERGQQHGGERPAGTGLGLAIARRIAEAHGGALTVTSEPGAGATFTFSLPHASAPDG